MKKKDRKIKKLMKKSSLTPFEIKIISDYQRSDLQMREDFESQIKVFIQKDSLDFTYALLYPYWPKYSGGKRWQLVFYSIVENSESRLDTSYHFSTEREMKKHIRKNKNLREPSEWEINFLKSKKSFNNHTSVSEVEELEDFDFSDIEDLFED